MNRTFALPLGIQRGIFLLWLLTLASWVVTSAAQAQTTLKSVEILQPKNGETLEADFVLPQADKVSTVEVSAGGTALDKEKIKFTPADKLPNYRCAILLLVDKTLGTSKDSNDKAKEKLWKAVRSTLTEIATVAGTAPYQFGVATISAGNLDILAPMGSEKSDQKNIEKGIINSAIEKLTFNGTSPELYLGTKRAIDWLGRIPAERKFLVLVSDGTSQDKVVSQQEVVEAALKAKVHICTIGFPKSTTAADGVQRLEPLAEETGGYSLRADGSESKLPPEAESKFVKFAVSGGKTEIDLRGLKAPVSLAFNVQTEFGKAYTFAHNVEAIEAAPPSPETTLTPEPPPSKWAALKARLKSHPVLSICGGIALAVALLFLGALLVNFLKKPGADIALDPPLPSTFEPSPIEPAEETTKVTVTEPEAPALAWLVILDAEETRYPITKSAIRIGRKPDNDIVMRNNSVSSYHAEILKRGDKFVITDLDSSNKILVRGQLVDKSSLEDGDVIELGEVRLRFVLNQLNDSLS
jgi:hypothetical protein